uniref:Cytochrome b561 domain-containing protein n=1 Tax=Caenorhabditis japonica TaxID=281687 RepID=A0A8R1IBM6_CAEJA
GVENLVNCQANGNDNTCQAQIAVDRFDKVNWGSFLNLPINVTLPESTQPVSFNLAALTPPPQEGLTKQQRRQFSKAHAILMILGWLFFVPTGFLFARLGKDLFKEQTLFGMAVWFQIHRAANFMGVVCICTSMLCIFI